MDRFHLSFSVPDLAQAKDFYTNIIGCEIGRDAGQWVDIWFFGHQLTLHQLSKNQKNEPLDHFGIIIKKEIWQVQLERCQAAQASFIVPATVKNENTENESGKFIISDPAKNSIEFKYYTNLPTFKISNG